MISVKSKLRKYFLRFTLYIPVLIKPNKLCNSR